jgi:hypothetical protein
MSSGKSKKTTRIYADYVNLLGENINIIKKNTGALFDASKEVDPKINAEKAKYVFTSHRQTTGQNNYIKVANTLKMW